MLVLIRNRGCDDTTSGLAKFETEKELNNFIKIIINLNKNSSYSCMPTISLYEISENKIRLLGNSSEDVRDVLSLNGKKYILNLKEYESIYDLEKTENDLIKKFIIKESF